MEEEVAVRDYRVWSNEIANTYTTHRPQMAMKLFLVDVVESNHVDKIGQVVVAEDLEEGEEYPMRTAPALYHAGIIDREIAVRGLSHILKISHYQADKVLDELAEEDSWLAEPLEEP